MLLVVYLPPGAIAFDSRRVAGAGLPGLDEPLDRLRLEDDVLEHALLRNAAGPRMVGDLRLFSPGR